MVRDGAGNTEENSGILPLIRMC